MYGDPELEPRFRPIYAEGELVNDSYMPGHTLYSELEPTETERLAHFVTQQLYAKVDELDHANRQRDAANTLARTHEISGIQNERAFLENLDKAVREVRATGEPKLLFYFDLNNFKQVNTYYEHDGGDEALTQIAHQFFERHLRSQEYKTLALGSDIEYDEGSLSSIVVAHLHGDEFAALADSRTSASAEETSNYEGEEKRYPSPDPEVQGQLACARIKRAWDTFVESLPDDDFLKRLTADPRVKLGISVGYGVITPDMADVTTRQDLKALLKAADGSMYQDKQHKEKPAAQ